MEKWWDDIIGQRKIINDIQKELDEVGIRIKEKAAQDARKGKK